MSVARKALEMTKAATEAIVQRAETRYEAHRQEIFRAADRMFAGLMIGQWIFAIFLALTLSPYAWQGKVKTVHMHVWIAVFLGAAITSLPVALAWFRPGEPLTRHAVAVGQMLWSALLIHLTGGRIETHFHVFGSLALLAFYRDWPVLLTGTVVVATDHLLRGILWPESVYGIPNPEWWRFLEHASWVVFCISFLILSCRRSQTDMRVMAERGAELEALSENQWRNSSVVERAAADTRGDR
jgi:two-component system, NtrC family, sensor histidine kinase HydH